jgi:hypothetical protein
VRERTSAVCHDRDVRDVLVVLFWLWLLVAVGVYGYRIVRRVSQGPKGERQARAAGSAAARADEAAPPRRGFGLTAPPPLPEGPLEPRLPRSLEGVIPEGDPMAPADTAPASAAAGGASPDHAPLPPAARPTLAEALAGITMPDALLPVVDPSLPGLADGRIAHFAGTGTTVAEVATALGDELRRLGYAVDGLDTMTTGRAGLSGTRDGTTVSAAIDLDDSDGSVRVQLST